MADVYCYSGAAGAATGADWANAYTTLQAAMTGAGAGGTVYLASDSAESAAVGTTITSPGTPTNPQRIVSVNRAGSVPPTSADVLAGASVTTTGTSLLTLAGSFYCYGVTLNCGTGASNASLTFHGTTAAGWQSYENCAFKLVNTGAGSTVLIGGTGGSATRTIWNNCTVSFAAAGQSIQPRAHIFEWRNTASAILGTAPTVLFSANTQNAGFYIIDGVDLSALSGKSLVAANFNTAYRWFFSNCKLPASLTVVQASSPIAGPNGMQIDLVNCDSGATVLREEYYRYQGSVVQDTATYRSSGATDPVSAGGKSWKLTTLSGTQASFLAPLEAPAAYIWNSVTGTAKTVTVPIVNDGTTLNTDEIWVDVEYLGDASSPQGSVVTSTKANVLASGTAIPTDAGSTWTTSGIASAVKQKLSVTFTPQMTGLFRVVVKMAKQNKAVWVDPSIQVA